MEPEAGFLSPQEDVTHHVAEDGSAQVPSEAVTEEMIPSPIDHQDLAHEDEAVDSFNARDEITSMTPKLLMPPPMTAVGIMFAILLLSVITILVVICFGCSISCYKVRWMHNIGQVVARDRGKKTTEARSSDKA